MCKTYPPTSNVWWFLSVHFFHKLMLLHADKAIQQLLVGWFSVCSFLVLPAYFPNPFMGYVVGRCADNTQRRIYGGFNWLGSRDPHHMCDMCLPLNLFYRRKFFCRRYYFVIGRADASISLKYYLILWRNKHLLVSWKSVRYLNLVNARPKPCRTH